MEKQFYTDAEKNLIKGAQILEESLVTKEKLLAALSLDILLLDMEAQQEMLDGLKGEEYLL